MLYMDPILQIAIFIITYIIITGILTFFNYNIGAIGIYMAYLGFIIISIMILPDPINISNSSTISPSIISPSISNIVNIAAAVTTPTNSAL